MKTFKWILQLCLPLLMIVVIGCTEQVPPGYVGMVMTPDGLTGQILMTGNHSCYGRDRLVIVEMLEQANTEKLKILVADDLNFGFDLKLRSRLNIKDGKALKSALSRQGANIIWNDNVGLLKYVFFYDTYAKDISRSLSRGIVSRYKTTDISLNRKKITDDIKSAILENVAGTPVEVTMVAVSNLDYPEVVTKAVEARRKREIQIGEEKAKQAMELLRATNRLKLAEQLKAVRAAEAAKEAIYIKMVGKAITPEYLAMRRIERDIILYQNIAPGDKVIITDGSNNVFPMIPVSNQPVVKAKTE